VDAPAPVRGGVIDADVLRQRWPEVLEAVRGQRRIAWMLLGPATVESLEGNVLTVAFPREGEAKGFASSGCDQVLAGVLSTMMGLTVRVLAVVGTAGAGPRSSSRPSAADNPAPGSGGGGHGGPGAGPTGSAAGLGAIPDAPDTGLKEPEPAVGEPGSAPGPDDGPVRAAPAGAAAPASRKAKSPASGAKKPAGAAAPRGAEASTPSAPGAGFDDEEWPDDAGPAADAGGPTGMALIEQQLGGRVIEEIDEP
jgi:DNA polymerase-3 subunit gamma/tau